MQPSRSIRPKVPRKGGVWLWLRVTTISGEVIDGLVNNDLIRVYGMIDKGILKLYGDREVGIATARSIIVMGVVGSKRAKIRRDK